MNQNISKSSLKILKLYKTLYKTREDVFANDTVTLNSSLARLRHEFRLNRNETDPTKIKQLIKTAKEVDNILKTSVHQVIKTDKENRFKLVIKPYMIKDNHISK
jgi:complex III assembly factor LYRM7